MTQLMQAHRQWMSRAPDERFTSLIDMQAFKRRLRDNSRSQVISSRGLAVRPVEDDARALQIMGYGNGLPAAALTATQNMTQNDIRRLAWLAEKQDYRWDLLVSLVRSVLDNAATVEMEHPDPLLNCL